MLDVLRDGVLNPPRVIILNPPRVSNALESSVEERGSDIEREMFGDAVESQYIEPLREVGGGSVEKLGKRIVK